MVHLPENIVLNLLLLIKLFSFITVKLNIFLKSVLIDTLSAVNSTVGKFSELFHCFRKPLSS